MIISSRKRPRSASKASRWLAPCFVLTLFFACYAEPSPPQEPEESTPSAGSGGDSPGPSNGGSLSGPSEAICGDGERSGDEQCDDSNLLDGDGCDAACNLEPVIPACGDGVPDPDEECDDGALQVGDGCDGSCREEVCGNGRIDPGEECDPAEAGKCTAHCNFVRPSCGDGAVQSEDEEECDDGNDEQGDGCFECRKECGDGRIDEGIGEQCDPGASKQGTCSSACTWFPACGDGNVQKASGEECDPSNGVTCVKCKIVEPPPPSCEGGAGGVSASGGEGGTCGSETCVRKPKVDLIENGKFATSTEGWKPQVEAIQLGTVNEGSPEPMALEVVFASAPRRSLSGAYQCVAIQAGKKYEFRGQYRIPEGAPAGMATGVTGLVYAGTRCEGSYVGKAQAGPVVSVRNSWTPYQHVFDTSVLGTAGEGRLLVRLNAIRPANAQGTRVLWDTVSLTEVQDRCGNCEIDSGETCDDGNQTAGDGCSATCGLEICGDGRVDAGEQCDDSNAVYGGQGDSCTPSCQTASACDECGKDKCAEQVTDCLALEGNATAGPRAGTARSTLCDLLRTCVHDTGCNKLRRRPIDNPMGEKKAALEHCYCGSNGEQCFQGQANGSCRSQIEAALETKDPVLVLERLSGADPRYPVFGAAKALLECEGSEASPGRCSNECSVVQGCGNGLIEDRDYQGTFVVNGQPLICQDEWTHTGRGCAFEECDDNNPHPGDGCDPNCMIEACGNYLVQAGEFCDDGNTVNGDGCSDTCQAEFTCGNSSIEAPFEQCDPPSTGAGRICTKEEAAQDPSQCGCDSVCRLLVCGNESVQAGEECDPPNGTRCGNDCKLIGLSPCEQCISTHPDIVPVNDLCLADPKCLAVKECVLEDECYLPVAAACYCGPGEDVRACENPSFNPKGTCAEALREGLTVSGETVPNAELLARFQDFDRPGGLAIIIVDEASRVCTSECFPSAPPAQ